MVEALISWTVIGILVVGLIGVAFSVLSMTPPRHRIAEVCFAISALLLWAKFSFWAVTSNATWKERLLVAFLVFGISGALLIVVLNWVERIIPQKTETSKLSVPAVSAVGTVIAPTYPAVDFILTPEQIPGNITVSHIPHLMLTIRNRGSHSIKDIRMRSTQYQLDLRFKVIPRIETIHENKIRFHPGETEFVIKNFVRIGKDSVKIRSVAPGAKSKPVDLSTIKEFKFVKPPGPGEPGGPGGPPLQGGPVGESHELRYYALRYSFIDDGTQKRYTFRQVISCQVPYLLPLDNPNMSIIGTGSDDWLLRPSQLIIDHQRTIYGSYLEEEYPKRQ